MQKELNKIDSAVVTEIDGSVEDINGKLKIKVENVNEIFAEDDPYRPLNISDVEILQDRKKKDSSLGLEGELLVTKKGETIVTVDINGDLIISDEFAEHFSINEQGELIYQR